MKLWKSLLATLLVLAALLTFVACDSGSKKKSKDDDDDDDDETEESSNVSGVSGEESGEESGDESGKENSKEESREESEDEDVDSLDGTVWKGDVDMGSMILSVVAGNDIELDVDADLYATMVFEFEEDTAELSYDLDQFEEDFDDYVDALVVAIYNYRIEQGTLDADTDFDEFAVDTKDAITSRVDFSSLEISQTIEYTLNGNDLDLDGLSTTINGKKFKVDMGPLGVITFKKA